MEGTTGEQSGYNRGLVHDVLLRASDSSELFSTKWQARERTHSWRELIAWAFCALAPLLDSVEYILF